MSAREKAAEEVKSLVQAGLYFTVWLGWLVVLKKLVLEEYQIGFQGLSVALLGALVLSKVVLILEHVSLGRWVEQRQAWVEVALRTLLYSFGVVVVLLLEKTFEGRHEAGSLVLSVASVFDHPDLAHVWVNTICLGGALLGYNVLWVIRRNLGPGGLVRLLRMPVPAADDEAGSR